MNDERQRFSELLIMPEQKELIGSVIKFQVGIRDEVRRQLLEQSSESLSEVVGHGAGDVTYKIDADVEPLIIQFGQEFSQKHSCLIVAEGIGQRKFPESTQDPEFKIIIDPIDGTREIMYDKRSAWVLTGVAKNKGEQTNFSDIDISVMTEIPPLKQNIASIVYAVRGGGAYEEEWDLISNRLFTRRKLASSKAQDIRHGFVVFGDYGRGSKEEIGRLADKVFEEILGPVEEGQFLVFNDQYISGGGQLYLMASGKYRFVADLRPEIDKILARREKKVGLAAHPYDITPFLIAQEAGAIVTDALGKPLSYPLDTDTNCTWIAYANESIRSQIEPVLQRELSLLLER